MRRNSSSQQRCRAAREPKSRTDSVTAFFGDKYGARVRVVKIGGGREQDFNGFSMELCGGTHTLTTAELGPFRLQSEGAIAAGVRRIEAVTGTHGLQGIFADVQMAEKLSRKLGVPILELENKVESLLEAQRKLTKQLEQARRAEARAEAGRLLKQVETRKEVPVLIANLGDANGEYLKWVADSLRDTQFKGVAVLAGVHDGRVALLASVDKSLNAQGLHAGKLIKELAAKVGGGGGGRPDLAEAGGKDPSKLAQALAEVSW